MTCFILAPGRTRIVADELHTIEWTGAKIRLIDQTRLPATLAYLDVGDVNGLVEAIDRLAVRGAPALGVTGALGVALAMYQAQREGWTAARMQREIDRIRDARPTAVNLAWGVAQVRDLIPQGIEAVLARARELMDEDERTNHAIGANGADWILASVARRPVRVLTHCNTGLLATTAWGTALGIVRELHARGVLERVYVDETRPLLQGSRLTAWELEQLGIPYVVEVDGAAASTAARHLVDVAIIGADRIAANGDTANKIGSLGVALACAHAGIPFVVAAPQSTVDLATPSGDAIEIEYRDPAEVTRWQSTVVTPPKAGGHNPAFDVTPGHLISALVTERGVAEVAKGRLPRDLLEAAA
jgi:methylthioribose-1-phosphate isomerase